MGNAHVLVLAKDYAEKVFHDAGVAPVAFSAFSATALERVAEARLGTHRPDVVFTSATSLPHLDMTERYLWRWSRKHRIPSVAVLDQWQNYALRFSGPGPDEHLRYFPDWIAVMDGHARRGMVAAGIPAERIVVTGQPAFDRLSLVRTRYDLNERNVVRQSIGVAANVILLCFVAEAISQDFGDRLGYTEYSVLRELLLVCERLQLELGISLHLAVKLHPQNRPMEFAWVRERASSVGMRVTLHWTEQPPIPLVMASDVVVGMTSMLLIESILLGRLTVSFQPGAQQREGLIATEVGAIPLLDSQAECLTTLRSLIQDPGFRTDYLQQQSRLSTVGGATTRVADLVRWAAKQNRSHVA